MKNLHQVSIRQASKYKNHVGIFCDLQNVLSIKEQGDFLLEFAKIKGCITCKKVYYNSQHKNNSETNAKNILESLGFDCVDVPDSSKNSADYRLMADCLKLFAPKLSSVPNIIILVLGDWDFAGLISVLKALNKRVIVFAQRGSASLNLIKLIGHDNFYFVDELPQLVQITNQPQLTTIDSQINYNEAIRCLKEAIKSALSQRKRTSFSNIDRLMRQNCMNYKGYFSITTPTGKKFKSFGHFVDFAVKTDKIQTKNQELFLIDIEKITA
jgi:hypothetical protein